MRKAKPPCLCVMTTEFDLLIKGGLGTVATCLTKALINANLKVSVMTISPSNRMTKARGKRLQILRLPKTNHFYNAADASFKSVPVEHNLKQVFVQKPDVLHIHSIQFAKAAISYKKKHKTPLVYTCHSLIALEPKPRSRSFFIKLNTQGILIRNADRIVVPSLWMKRELSKLFPSAAAKTIVIHHGITPVSRLTKAPRHKLLFVGRIIPLKGIDELLESIALLKRRNKEVRLTLIGKGSRRYLRHLRFIVRKRGLTSHINWLGFQSQGNVNRMYAQYGAVVMPSKQESFGLVALEAMGNGVPLVSMRSGGLAEFVSTATAQIIKSVSSKQIAHSIATMWNKKKLTDRRVKSAKLVARKYRWPNVAFRYKKLFSSL